QCKCKDQDQRDVCQEGYCNNITEETPIDACPCPEDKNELKNDKRYTKGGLCASGSFHVAKSVVVFSLFQFQSRITTCQLI
ncbi:MAG: hypothetical protein EZS28_049771, partial [Streblomastix strix]